MLIREVRLEEKNSFDAVVGHPLQSWSWGDFRKKNGQIVERIGFYDNGQLKKAIQVTFHTIPKLNRYVGYFPRGFMPDEEQLSALKQLAEKHKALFIKMEPNIAQKIGTPSAHANIHQFLTDRGALLGRPLFTKYTFQLDLTKSEEELFQNLSSKTRYNVRLALKKGVQIIEDTTQEGMERYLEILKETTTRQGFYAHTPEYFQTMWENLGHSGMMRIFHAVYEDTILTSWVMFEFNGVLYYPYGASRSIHRNVMASNLMMWEMIKFGKNQGCTMFDMWGSLGPESDPKHPWSGFHRFKEGYGGDQMEFLGTYDIVYQPFMYKLFKLAETIRWQILRFKAKFWK